MELRRANGCGARKLNFRRRLERLLSSQVERSTLALMRLINLCAPRCRANALNVARPRAVSMTFMARFRIEHVSKSECERN